MLMKPGRRAKAGVLYAASLARKKKTKQLNTMTAALCQQFGEWWSALPVFHPGSLGRVLWDILITLLVIASTVAVPLQVR